MAHVIESHPQRKFIIDALLAGRPLRSIAVTLEPKVSVMALQRYKAQVVRPALSNAVVVAKLSGKLTANGKTIDPKDVDAVPESVAATAVQTASGLLQHADITDPYLARITKHQQIIDESLEFACANEDPRSVAALITTDIKGMELHARISGVPLDGPQSKGGNVNLAIMLNIPRAIPDNPSPTIELSVSSPAVDITSQDID